MMMEINFSIAKLAILFPNKYTIIPIIPEEIVIFINEVKGNFHTKYLRENTIIKNKRKE